MTTPATWRKSSQSGNNNCVEVANVPSPAIRDSKNPAGTRLNVEPACWAPFVAALKAGSFDR